MAEICGESPTRNSPRIVALIGDEAIQYFIVIEQDIYIQVPTFQLALFVVFSSYYIFNLAYPKQMQKVLYFLQDYVLGMPDSSKRPGAYLATASDINKFMSESSQSNSVTN